MKISTLSILTLLACLCLSSADAAVVEYAAGHGDIGLAFENGELELHYHFGDGAVLDGAPLVGDLEVDPADAYVRVGDNANVPILDALMFLRPSPNDPVWVLPQSGTNADAAGLPFLGIATEELQSTDFSSATISLTDFSGPGQFALWQGSGANSDDVKWQTSNGLNDPLNPDDLTLGIGSHDHFQYGFTAEGVYDLELTAVANRVGGGSVTDVGTFRFVVGTATAVPEPGSLAALAIGSGAIALMRRRRNGTKLVAGLN